MSRLLSLINTMDAESKHNALFWLFPMIISLATTVYFSIILGVAEHSWYSITMLAMHTAAFAGIVYVELSLVIFGGDSLKVGCDGLIPGGAITIYTIQCTTSCVYFGLSVDDYVQHKPVFIVEFIHGSVIVLIVATIIIVLVIACIACIIMYWVDGIKTALVRTNIRTVTPTPSESSNTNVQLDR